jgi:hypothetical protein
MDMLETLPPAEYERYVLGNWEYGDDPQQLIQYVWMKNIFTEAEEYKNRVGKIRLGIDVARYGDDSTVFAFMKGNVLFKFEEFKKISTTQTAQLALLRMHEYGIQGEDVGIDVVGLGAGVVDTLVAQGHPVKSFNSGEKANSQQDFFLFENKKAEASWFFREDVRLEKIETIEVPDFVAEATTIRYEITNKTIRIESKDSIKKRLKRSPNYLDAAIIVNYLRHLEDMQEDFDVEKYRVTKRVYDIYDDNLNVRSLMRSII